jgi:hypothetical protein
MKSRFNALIQPSNTIPLIIAGAAIIFSLDPKPFGVEIAERQIILALFAFLAADAIIERSGRIYSIDRKLDALRNEISGPAAASKILRTRSSFERMDVILRKAVRSITIIGINLDGGVIGLGPILDLARAGGTVKLLAMDPDGACILPSATMSEVDPEIRREKIRQNLMLLKGQIVANLSGSARRRIHLSVVDRILPVSAVALDWETPHGSLIIQHHLTSMPAELAPMLLLSKEMDADWFQRYVDQCNACFKGAREWQ